MSVELPKWEEKTNKLKWKIP